MALEGNLEDFSLTDMFRLVESGKKSGTLEVASDDCRGMVCFAGGAIFFAASSRRPEPLGRRLVTAGLVTEKQLRQALGLQKIQKKEKAARRLGQILVEEGYVEEEAIERFVQETFYDTLFDLFRLGSGHVRFDQEQDNVDQDVGSRVSVDSVVAEMRHRLDEWKRIRERVPGMDSLFLASASPGDRSAEIHLKPAEWLVLCELHGGRTVRELIDATGTSDFEISRTLYAMQAAGLVRSADAVVDIVASAGSAA